MTALLDRQREEWASADLERRTSWWTGSAGHVWLAGGTGWSQAIGQRLLSIGVSPPEEFSHHSVIQKAWISNLHTHTHPSEQRSARARALPRACPLTHIHSGESLCVNCSCRFRRVVVCSVPCGMWESALIMFVHTDSDSPSRSLAL